MSHSTSPRVTVLGGTGGLTSGESIINAYNVRAPAGPRCVGQPGLLNRHTLYPNDKSRHKHEDVHGDNGAPDADLNPALGNAQHRHRKRYLAEQVAQDGYGPPEFTEQGDLRQIRGVDVADMFSEAEPDLGLADRRRG